MICYFDTSNIKKFYFHPDHLGSSTYISNDLGVVSQHAEYLPFGELLVDEHKNSNNSPFKFNGKLLDEETGNYYYGARYYDPKWSSFISVDPLAEKTMDAYGYCYQNPVKLVDPDGKAPMTDFYNLRGKKIGSDGESNGERVVVRDNSEARTISKTSGHVDSENVKSGYKLPSDAALKESLNVLERQVNNGGLREEASLVMKNGSSIRQKTGPEPTIIDGNLIAPTTLPTLPAGATAADVEVTIHSHSTKIFESEGLFFPQSASVPSTGPYSDQTTFTQFGTNIIVGPIGTISRIGTKPDGTPNIPNRPNGAVFYDSNSVPQLTLTKEAIERILSPQ